MEGDAGRAACIFLRIEVFPLMSRRARDSKTVLQLTGMRCTKYGGLEQYIAEIVRRCRDCGFNSLLQYESRPQSDEYLSVLEQLGAGVIVVETAPRRVKNLLATAGLLRSAHPDVVHTHFAQTHTVALAATLGRRFGARRVVSMVHGEMGHREPFRGRHAFNRCDHVLAVSDAVRRDLLAGGIRDELLTTHYIGLIGERDRSAARRQAIRAELHIPAGAVVVGNIAFDAPVKGVDVLLAAMQKVVGHRADVYLLQVGIDPAVSALRAAAIDLGVDDFVRWAGIRDLGWQLLNAADFYVQPSRDGEGLGLAILEAMALRLPVIATSVGGIPEAVVDGRTGILVPPADPIRLSEGILDLARRQSDWQSLGDAGHARFRERFDGRRSVARLVDAFYSL
jgi:glycosyltransferase involved in cell wall biosynthesis